MRPLGGVHSQTPSQYHQTNLSGFTYIIIITKQEREVRVQLEIKEKFTNTNLKIRNTLSTHVARVYA